MNNILLMTDSYKLSHWKQYPPKTEVVYSYFESRGGKFPQTLFFGLQYFLKKYLEGEVVTKKKIDEAEAFAKAHFGRDDCFNRKGWEHILIHHSGKLPVSIKAVPEGTMVDNHNVLMTIENTDPACWWLTNYLETLLVQTWYPSTVATQSHFMKEILLYYLNETGDPSLIDFKLHDFGFRGSTSVESAGIGGAAHLVNFKGTDTIAGAIMARDYYGEEMAGFSIPASEHSTITAWGKENECKAFANMLEQYPEGLVACVSDSYDIYKACSKYWGEELKQKVIERSGTLVVRPDSGDPPEVVVEVLRILGEKFGYVENKKGYKVLPPYIRVIQGDGIYVEMLDKVLGRMKRAGWSADNITFGSGGGLLQRLNRDTQRFAFKCSSVTIDGKEKEVHKDPITARGKVSKAGRLMLVTDDEHNFYTVGPSEGIENHLVEVFREGKILKEYTFEEIRKRS